MKVVVGGGKVVPLPIGFERAGGKRPSLRLETPPDIVGRKSFLFRLVVGRPPFLLDRQSLFCSPVGTAEMF